MKFLYVIILLCASINYSNAFAADSGPEDSLSPKAKKLSKECNIEARNALIHGDLELVEKVCMQAVTEIDRSDVNKEYLIDPILNLAYSYTLAGLFDKATPLYNRARHIREQLYEPGSKKLQEIDKLIRAQEEMKKQFSGQ